MEVMAFEDLLEDPVIQKYLHELVGPKGMPVAAAPPDGEVTDEELAEELDLELNDVRRALFILYENDLATYRRLRDEDSGWLTYLWTFEYDNIPENLEEEMYRLHEALDDRRVRAKPRVLPLRDLFDPVRVRRSDGLRLRVSGCGSPLESMDNDRLVNAMDDRLASLEDELNLDA